MKVLYFAFANDPSNPLPGLQHEADEIMRLLSPGELKQRYIIYLDPFATREKIAYYLTQYKDQLTLFHYSGHAGDHLLETGGEVSHAKGIAHLLGQCKTLKLVFLNGCSTDGQVKGLWESGVPAILATSAPVGDQKAAHFAIRFYQALSVEDTLETAFELAKGDLLTQSTETDIQLHRKINFEGAKPVENAVAKWGFFVRESDKLFMQWKLPQQQNLVPLPDFEPNSLLIDQLIHALAPFNREIRNINRDEEEGEEIDFADKRLAILNSLPAPIAEHLRKLMVPLGDQGKGFDKISPARVEQIVCTFETMIELFTYTSMAQLWDALLAIEGFTIPQKQLESIRQFFLLDHQQREKYQFIPLLRNLREIFDANQETYFIEEWDQLKDSYEANSSFSLSCDYLYALKRRLERSDLASHEVSEACKRAEQSLSSIFSELGFLAKYTLAAVRMIDVVKFRHNRKATFRHALVKLVKLMGGLEEKSEELDSFMDSRSVLLLKKGKEKSEYLNLSPFVIDENAFDERTTDVSKVFFFYRYDQAQDKYVFRHAYKPDDLPLIISDAKYGIVKAQFEAFAKLLFNKEMKQL